MSKITIICHEVHSYQSCEMPLRLYSEIRRINHLLVSHSEKNPGRRGEAVLPHITHIGMCRPKGYGFGAVLVWKQVWFSDQKTAQYGFITRFRHNLYWLMGCLFNLLITARSKFLRNGRMTHKNGSFQSHNISLLKKSWLFFFYTTVCLSGLVILL